VKLKLEGHLLPATVTPFTSTGAVDFDDLKQHIARTASVTGVSGVVVNGHAGEILAMSSAERKQVVAAAREALPPRKKLFAGIEATRLEDLVAEGNTAAAAGADGLLVLPLLDIRPYRQLSKIHEVVYKLFQTLDREIGIPMIVFQYPDASGVSYSIPALKQIVELPHVVAIKAACGTVSRYAEAWNELNQKTTVLTANDAPPLLGMLLHGAHGALIGISVIGTPIWAEMVKCALKGDAERAKQIYNKSCIPLMKAVFENQEPTPVISHFGCTKEALFQLGELRSPYVRFPEIPVDTGRKELIRKALVAAGMLLEPVGASR
jgi:4-hydroxy-tetrahydrodipicolinate synthase